ncbi:MAG TPA: indole-3-glycerol phosphate synthase TrpC [Terriglobales bacterium]|nr:indole-3-glycerol phosphate synthase TrpC [Terriglobales bacterium]
MPASLDQILASARQKLASRRASLDIRQLERNAEKHVPRGFRHSLAMKSRDGTAIIAELKKASPSRGLIRANFDATLLARELENAGAAALSVLTDEEFFQGSIENLQKASAATRLPCLRKDFIFDEIQIIEARANRADAVLLIAAALSQAELLRLAQCARNFGLDVLCEVHDRDELQRALDAGFDLIGVNSRDLRTFKVDLQTAFRLAVEIPETVVRVAESGIRNGNDLAKLCAAGYHAFLIGESLMSQESPGQTLRTLLSDSAISLRTGH